MENVCRLNYIGSKFQLLDWITENIQKKIGSFENKIIGDLFAGTGIVSYHFRNLKNIIYSNDSELYSSIITHAFTCSNYNEKCQEIINLLNSEIEAGKRTIGFVTQHYSPYTNERMFFTVDNAKCIDYVRERLEKFELNKDDYNFILGSIIISADAISNVPAVYGCYLKNFKAKALKKFYIKLIHKSTNSNSKSLTFNKDIVDLKLEFMDLVYLDPPYNQRQYSKNYFPLNIIAKTPAQLNSEPPLKGKTGIPTDCFISPFCKTEKVVETVFNDLFKSLNTNYIFLSYNSESIVKKDKMIEIMKKYGDVSVVEKEYKRFKSFEYNKSANVIEYLFCLNKYKS
jgi:adenine-specific DNA-methyltransferase